MTFYDRQTAAQLLAQKLEKYKNKDTIIYALPRGGVVLGAEIAKCLKAPLDLIIPRKIGHPSNPEYAIGAITEDGYLVSNQAETAMLDPEWFQQAAKAEQKEAKRRRRLYLAGRPTIPAKNKVAIIVDDGVATGLTMRAAIKEIKDRHPAKIVIAVPVLPRDIAGQLLKQADEIIALDVPQNYRGAVGSYYLKFDQVQDAEVIDLLR